MLDRQKLERNQPEIRRRRRSLNGRPRLLPRVALILAGFLVAGVIGAGAYFLPVLTTTVNAVGAGQIGTVGYLAGSDQPFTVLLLGSDDDAKFPADAVLTQSMILVRVNPGTKQVTMLSIPRDLWVTIPGRKGKAKIDTAYEYGGAKLAAETVETNFHIKVDDYVWVGLKGLIHLIDRMGGVDVNITNPVMDDFYPSDIDVKNPYGYYRLALLPGAVHLDGAHALQYVRSRHGDLRGDFARSERQQQVLLALKAESKQVSLSDLPDLASAFNGELKSSIGLDRVRAMMGLVSRFGTSGIQQVVLLPPYTTPQMVGDQDVIVPNWTLILPLVHQSFP